MRLSDFKSALNGEKSFPDFFLKIREEVDVYKELISPGKRRVTIPIHLEEDIDELILTVDDVKKLGRSFLNKEISIYELGYLADALTLSEIISYDYENSKDAIHSFTDPEINGEITYESVQKAIDGL